MIRDTTIMSNENIPASPEEVIHRVLAQAYSCPISGGFPPHTIYSIAALAKSKGFTLAAFGKAIKKIESEIRRY